ncbi:hypothetical protein [uncultured Clostridium sp.]|uniref:hypothetical protein n=1 Tax=uncultured Clostridium sp. TaxID=59620 RepID=UPI00260C45AC|nr:hypothetical protein [uncultured Clostridium sp.]
MKNKKFLGLFLVILIILIFSCGMIIYNKKSRNNITANNTTPTKNSSISENINPSTTNTKITNTSTKATEKPKMLTGKEISEKEKEAAEAQKIRDNNENKYVSLEEAQEYVATKSTALLIKQFPSEKDNETIIKNKMNAILKTTMTAKALKETQNLNGPTYDLNKFDVEIKPTNDCKFAFNISTNNLINNSNEYIFISNDHSAE